LGCVAGVIDDDDDDDDDDVGISLSYLKALQTKKDLDVDRTTPCFDACARAALVC